MSDKNIDFDEEGNLIPQKIKIKIKHDAIIEELIQKLKKEKKVNVKIKA